MMRRIMGIGKQVARGAAFPSLGTVPSLRHCTARKKAILIEFRRYPCLTLFQRLAES